MLRLSLLAATAMIAANALPALAQDAPPPPAPMPPEGTMLTMVAEGSSVRTPDVALIRAGVVTQAATAGEAMTQNGAKMAAALAALRKAGVAERDIQTSAIALNPQYRYEQNQPPILTGYQASNQVTVRFRDVAKSGAILDTLVRAGANNVSGPDLVIDKPDAALDEARTDAIAKARARAELYAKAAGLRVERMVSISESQSISRPMPASYAVRARVETASDATEVVAGESKLTVAVTVRYLLK